MFNTGSHQNLEKQYFCMLERAKKIGMSQIFMNLGPKMDEISIDKGLILILDYMGTLLKNEHFENWASLFLSWLKLG